MWSKKWFIPTFFVTCIIMFSGCPESDPGINIEGRMLCYGGEADATIIIKEDAIPIDDAVCTITFADVEYDLGYIEFGSTYYENLPEPDAGAYLFFSIMCRDVVVNETIIKPSDPVITDNDLLWDSSGPIRIQWEAPANAVDAIEIRIPDTGTLSGEEYIAAVDDPTDTSFDIPGNTVKSEDSIPVFVVFINQAVLSGEGIESGSIISVRILDCSTEIDTM